MHNSLLNNYSSLQHVSIILFQVAAGILYLIILTAPLVM